MSKNKWVRSVSFNKNNPQDIARLKLIGKKQFSTFIKKLIDEELTRQEVIPTANTKPATPQPQQKVKPVTNTKPVIPKKKAPVPKKTPIFNPMLGNRS